MAIGYDGGIADRRTPEEDAAAKVISDTINRLIGGAGVVGGVFTGDPGSWRSGGSPLNWTPPRTPPLASRIGATIGSGLSTAASTAARALEALRPTLARGVPAARFARGVSAARAVPKPGSLGPALGVGAGVGAALLPEDVYTEVVDRLTSTWDQVPTTSAEWQNRQPQVTGELYGPASSALGTNPFYAEPRPQQPTVTQSPVLGPRDIDPGGGRPPTVLQSPVLHPMDPGRDRPRSVEEAAKWQQERTEARPVVGPTQDIRPDREEIRVTPPSTPDASTPDASTPVITNNRGAVTNVSDAELARQMEQSATLRGAAGHGYVPLRRHVDINDSKAEVFNEPPPEDDGWTHSRTEKAMTSGVENEDTTYKVHEKTVIDADGNEQIIYHREFVAESTRDEPASPAATQVAESDPRVTEREPGKFFYKDTGLRVKWNPDPADPSRGLFTTPGGGDLDDMYNFWLDAKNKGYEDTGSLGEIWDENPETAIGRFNTWWRSGTTSEVRIPPTALPSTTDSDQPGATDDSQPGATDDSQPGTVDGDQSMEAQWLKFAQDTQNAMLQMEQDKWAADKALEDAMLRISAYEAGTGALNQFLQNPTAAWTSAFVDPRNAGQPVPVTPGVGSLLRQQGVQPTPLGARATAPMVGITPEQLTPGLFQDVINTLTSRDLANLSQPGSPVMSNLIAFGQLAGINPRAALAGRSQQLPQQRGVGDTIFGKTII